MGGTLLRGEVDQGGPQPQQLGADLRRLPHRDGEDRGGLGIFVAHSRVEVLLPPLGQCGALAGELLQNLAAQLIQGGQGKR